MKNSDYSKSIAATIKAFLDDSNRPYSFDETMGVFKSYSMFNSKIKTIASVFVVHSDFFLSYSYFPFGIKFDRKVKSAVAEFLTYANRGMVKGNFEFDFNDGELLFKRQVDCPDGNLSKEMIKECVGISTLMMNLYGPGVLDVIYSKTDPLKAAQKCELENKLRLLNDATESSNDEETDEFDFNDDTGEDLRFEDLCEVEEE